MSTDLLDSFPPPTAPAAIDPALQARLERLAAARAPRAAVPATARTTSPGSARKRHPAKGSRAAAVMMSVAATAGLAAYFQHVDSASASSTTLSGTAVASGTAATTATSATTASTAASAGSSVLADGTYTGATATNKWGPVQVQITVSGGQITAVEAVQTPSDDRKSVSINARATPVLASEVLTAQGAQIDTVSGATYTSTSYKASLQSAIDLAQSTAVQTSASS